MFAARAASTVGRRMASTAAGRAGLEETSQAHARTMEIWKRVSLFVGLPCVAVMTKLFIIDGHAPAGPEYKEWPHLHKLTKKFPWGSGYVSLFHNPHANGLHPDRAAVDAEHKDEGVFTHLFRSWMEDPAKRAEQAEALYTGIGKSIESHKAIVGVHAHTVPFSKPQTPVVNKNSIGFSGF
eukprot:m.96719 g.96719  ORF g.96719 m.96719 type:complete len:181 (-) comp15497_c0_seq1:2455-2997(-)